MPINLRDLMTPEERRADQILRRDAVRAAQAPNLRSQLAQINEVRGQVVVENYTHMDLVGQLGTEALRVRFSVLCPQPDGSNLAEPFSFDTPVDDGFEDFVSSGRWLQQIRSQVQRVLNRRRAARP